MRVEDGHTCVQQRKVGADAANWGWSHVYGTNLERELLGREPKGRPSVWNDRRCVRGR